MALFVPSLSGLISAGADPKAPEDIGSRRFAPSRTSEHAPTLAQPNASGGNVH